MKALLTLSLWFSIFFFFSCGEKQASLIGQMATNDALTVKEAYVQKEVPGLQGEAIMTFLKMQFDLASEKEFTVEKVVFRGQTYSYKDSSLKQRLQLISPEVKAEDSSLLIFYKLDDNRYYLKLASVPEREAIYLP